MWPKSRTKKTAAKPPIQARPVVIRQASNVQVLNGKFLRDLQRDYDEKGYEIFDWVLETHPLEYFKALVQLSKIVRVEADVTHWDGAKPRSIYDILQKVEEQTGQKGRAAFKKFLAKVRQTPA